MAKAQKGDLIRIVNAEDTRYKNGDILEVLARDTEDYDGVVVTKTGDKGEEIFVYDEEYEIHRKAGEEDAPINPVGKLFIDGEYVTDVTPIAIPSLREQQIRQASDALGDLLIRKNHDYGDSFSQQYDKYGLMSALIRMDDKMRRLETLRGGQQAEVAESISDTLLDLAGYALLAYVETHK